MSHFMMESSVSSVGFCAWSVHCLYLMARKFFVVQNSPCFGSSCVTAALNSTIVGDIRENGSRLLKAGNAKNTPRRCLSLV